MKKVCLVLLALVMGFSAISCTSPTGQNIAEAKSNKPRITAPNVLQANTDLQAEGNLYFTFDLYQTIKSDKGNFFFSPYSISMALAMTYAGARGDTERQMAEILHFTLPQNELHPTFNALNQELSKRSQGDKSKDEKGFRLNIADAIWR